MYSKEIIESQIATENRHLFMYGKNTTKRNQLLKCIEKKYPFKFYQNQSSVVYIDKIGLPNVNTCINSLNKIKINRIAISYLEFEIIQNIVQKINQVNDANNSVRLIEIFNSISHNNYENIDEILKSLEFSKNFYSKFYEEYLKTGSNKFARENFCNLDITFIPDLSMFVKNIQEETNNSSSFQLILDKKEKIPLVSIMAINSLINMRCNREFSIKVACAPDEWETYIDLNGGFVEYVHDYGILELDNSYSEYLKAEEKKYNFEIDD